MNKIDQIIKVVKDYECGKLNTNAAIKAIFDISGHEIDRDYLDNYWRDEDIESFAASLAIEAIHDWQNIDDARALDLIQEMINNMNNNAVMYRNSEALEKKFNKPAGQLIDLLFDKNINDPVMILRELKKVTTILT